MVDASGRRRRVIFDTEDDKAPLMINIRHLKVDLSEIDCVVLSHGPIDHTGATVELVGTAGGVEVYAHPHMFLPRSYEERHGRRTRGGVPKGEGVAEIEGAGGEVVPTSEPRIV